MSQFLKAFLPTFEINRILYNSITATEKYTFSAVPFIKAEEPNLTLPLK